MEGKSDSDKLYKKCIMSVEKIKINADDYQLTFVEG